MNYKTLALSIPHDDNLSFHYSPSSTTKITLEQTYQALIQQTTQEKLISESTPKHETFTKAAQPELHIIIINEKCRERISNKFSFNFEGQ